jgi:hypothetical protein
VRRQQDAGSDLEAELIPITVPELLRLLRDTAIPPPRRDRTGCTGRTGAAATSTAPAKPTTLERLRRGNTMITTNYSCRIFMPSPTQLALPEAIVGTRVRAGRKNP